MRLNNIAFNHSRDLAWLVFFKQSSWWQRQTGGLEAPLLLVTTQKQCFLGYATLLLQTNIQPPFLITYKSGSNRPSLIFCDLLRKRIDKDTIADLKTREYFALNDTRLNFTVIKIYILKN